VPGPRSDRATDGGPGVLMQRYVEGSKAGPAAVRTGSAAVDGTKSADLPSPGACHHEVGPKRLKQRREANSALKRELVFHRDRRVCYATANRVPRTVITGRARVPAEPVKGYAQQAAPNATYQLVGSTQYVMSTSSPVGRMARAGRRIRYLQRCRRRRTGYGHVSSQQGCAACSKRPHCGVLSAVLAESTRPQHDNGLPA
jgi:hypothetical protein